MHNRILYLVLIVLTQGLVTYGQTGTNSPYARYGYGSISHVAFGKNQAMGGLGIGIRSNANISPLNPASYSEIDTLSQIFEFGLAGAGVRYEDIRSSSYNADMNFSYLGIGFPASRWWGVGLGLVPIGATHPAERRRVAAGVVTHRVDLVARDVQLVAAAVLEQQVVALDAADGSGDHALEARHAVDLVHHVVADLQFTNPGADLDDNARAFMAADDRDRGG